MRIGNEIGTTRVLSMKKIILDLCGGTGAWSRPYLEAGYDVRNISLSQNDVRLFEFYPKLNVHGILAAPPCTHFAGSGARWWEEKGIEPIKEGLAVVDACLRIITVYQPKWWVLENPVGRLPRWLGKPKIYFQPCDYGDPYTKKTGLWGKFNIPIKNPVEPEFVEFTSKKGEKKRMSKQHWDAFKLPPQQRMIARSITPAGFANAFFKANP